MASPEPVLRYFKLSSFAFAPTRGSPYSVGADLFSPTTVIIPPYHRRLIYTDLSIQLPLGTYGRIAPRSGIAHLYGITTGAGVIDPDFTGNVAVLLFNLDANPYTVYRGDRIAQLICERALFPAFAEAQIELSETVRGPQGLGSTGI